MPGNEKHAYLTFDDGPSLNTEAILQILSFYGIRATFFVTGRTDDRSMSIYKRIQADGHAVGMHTYSHHYPSIYASVEGFWEDYRRLEALLEAAIQEAPAIYRFPGGSNNRHGERIMKQLTAMLQEAGIAHFDWNVDSRDASAALLPFESIIDNVLNGCADKRDAVILMHDAPAKTSTVCALPEIINGLRARHYQFRILTPESPPCRFPVTSSEKGV